MKHNSAIKQMMREFNTQVALKETEVDSAVKETIGKTGKRQFSQKIQTKFDFVTVHRGKSKVHWKCYCVFNVSCKSCQVLT